MHKLNIFRFVLHLDAFTIHTIDGKKYYPEKWTSLYCTLSVFYIHTVPGRVLTAHRRIRIFDDKLDSNNNNNNDYYYYYFVCNRIFSMEIIIIYVHRIENGSCVSFHK